MIRETYKGRKLKAVEGKGSEYGYTRVTIGKSYTLKYMGKAEKALASVRGTIDHADEVGAGSARYAAEWYAPGTFELCDNGHTREIGGLCRHSYCAERHLAAVLDAAYAEQAEREQVAPEAAESPVVGLVAKWQSARAELAELERAEHPNVTDRFGRVWSWWKGDLYRHCGNAAPKHMIGDFGLPTQAALDNPNYELCDTCLDGRERHVTACKREWKCSHAACARIHLSEDIDEAYTENEARYAEAQAQADAEQVVDFRLEVEVPTQSLEVRTEGGRRFPTELRLDLTGPLLEVFVPRDEDDETFALDAEPDHFGVYDAEDCGRLYWTIPLLELDEAERFLESVKAEAERIVAGTTFTGGYFELSPAARDATDRIALRCAELAL